MENLIQVASVPVITAVVYGAMELYKYIVNGKESLIRLIPVIAVVLGACIGIAAYYGISGIVTADNVLNALLIGGSSGLAATGTNQIFKQLTKDKKEDNNDGKN